MSQGIMPVSAVAMDLDITHKTKGAFEGARGAIQTYGSLGSLEAPLGYMGVTLDQVLFDGARMSP